MPIAFNNSSTYNSWSALTSHTFAFTCSGTNRILLVWFYSWDVTSCTYAWASLTQIQTIASSVSLWYLANPATGSNNIVASLSWSAYLRMLPACYTWVAQTSPINTSNQSGGSSQNFTSVISSTIDKCWHIAYATTGIWRTFSAWASTTFRQQWSSNNEGWYDKWADVTPSWSNTLNINTDNNGAWDTIWVMLIPFVPKTIWIFMAFF